MTRADGLLEAMLQAARPDPPNSLPLLLRRLQSLICGAVGVSQLPLSLGRTEKHLLSSHADAIDGHERLISPHY